MRSKGKLLAQHLVQQYHLFAPKGIDLGSWIIDYLKGIGDEELEGVMDGK